MSSEIRCALARSSMDNQLLLQEQVFSDDCVATTRLDEPSEN